MKKLFFLILLFVFSINSAEWLSESMQGLTVSKTLDKGSKQLDQIQQLRAELKEVQIRLQSEEDKSAANEQIITKLIKIRDLNAA